MLWSTPGGHYDREAFQLVDRELQKNLYAIGGKEFHPAETQPPAEEPLRGDLNGDKTVGVADAVMLTKYLLCADTAISEAADLDGNGTINAADLSALKQLILK